MHSAVAVANHFIRRALDEGVSDVNPPKLHELVYIAHGWHLGARGKRLIGSPVMAARDGIYLQELREAGCVGNKVIVGELTVVTMDENRAIMTESTPAVPAGDPAVSTLQYTWQAYGKLTPYEISRFTREVGSPWDLVWNDEARHEEEGQPVPNGTIKLWFRELLKQTPGLSRTMRGQGEDSTQTQTHAVTRKIDPNRLRSV